MLKTTPRTHDPDYKSRQAKLNSYLEKNYDLSPERLIQREIDLSSRNRQDKKIYHHKLLECFNTDELFKDIVERVSNKVAEAVLSEAPSIFGLGSTTGGDIS